MQKYEIQWFSDNEGIKLFNSDNSSLILIDFQKEDLSKAQKILKDIKFTSGVYILEGIDENNDSKKDIYVGESDNVWTRIKNHLQKKSTLKDKDFINFVKRISIILSNDNIKELGKTQIQWFEKELINEFFYLPNINVKNKNKESNKTIGIINEKSWALNLDYIKKALYHIGKSYFITSLEDSKVTSELKNADSNIDTKKWIEVFPIIRENRDIKVDGKFEYNILLEIVKAYKGATFEGFVKGSPSNYENLSYSLKKYKDKGFLQGYIDELTGKYKIQVIKNLELKPSPLACFIRAGISNGWVCWKDKKGKLIYQYRKEISKTNKKNSPNIIENKLKNIEIEDDEQKWIEVFPIIGKKLVKIYDGKFDYNLISQVIKVYKGTAFEGIIKGSFSNDFYLNDSFNKYKNKGFLEGYFDRAKREYKIWVVKDLELKPSTLIRFTKAGVSNGWMFWKDKKGKLIYQYRKEVSKTNKKNSANIIENKLKNIEIKDDEQKWIEVFPIIGKKLVKIYDGKFDYNLISQVIKVYKGTAFEGIIKGSSSNDFYLNDSFNKYKNKGFLEGYFDRAKREYKVWVIKDLELKPSTLTRFTRAGVSNGWMFWKNRSGELINKYKKHLKTNKSYFMKNTKNKSENFHNYLANKKNDLKLFKNYSTFNYDDKSYIQSNFNEDENWFEVFPVFSKKDNVRVNENAKFQCNIFRKSIKISKGTIFRGIIKKKNYYDNLSNYFKKYKNKGNAKGSIDFLTYRYEIEVTKDLITSPSTAAFFTKAGVYNNGWLCWQNKEGVLIKNIKNINENQE